MQTKTRSRIILMLLLFVLADLAMLLVFGRLLLDGTEFTGPQIAARLWESLGQQPPEGFTQTQRFFRWQDYLTNCTKYCLIEDLAVTLIYSLYLIGSSKIAAVSRSVRTSYFWLVHTCIKILLNVNSTVMFLGTLEYARDASWETYPPDHPLNPWVFTVPEDCFAAQRSSLILGLGALAAAFFLVLAIRWLQTFLPNRRYIPAKPVKPKKKPAGPVNLYFFSAAVLLGLLGITGLWAVVGIARSAENMNTLNGMQYSGIVRFAVPAGMVLNSLFFRLEQLRPDKYLPHRQIRYLSNSLLLIVISCGALMLFSEFGSIISLLALSVLILCFDMQLPAFIKGDFKKPLLYFVCTLVLGAAAGISLILIENAVLQDVAADCGFLLEGKAAFLPAASGFTVGLGKVLLGITALLLSAALIYALGLPGILCGLALSVTALAGISVFFSADIAKFAARQTAASAAPDSLLRRITVFLLAILQNDGLIPLGIICFLVSFGTAVYCFFFRRNPGEHKPVAARVYPLGIILFIAAVIVIVFNFAAPRYRGDTILRSFYMTAGNFRTDYEITADVTAKRRNAVAAANRLTDPKDRAAARAELNRQYNNRVYEGDTAPRIMRMIDRLCFSTKTDELRHVLYGLRTNMGFDYKSTMQHETYHITLQKKDYVTKEDFDRAPEAVKRLYLADSNFNPADGKYNFRDGYRIAPRYQNSSLEFLLYSAYLTRDKIESDESLTVKYMKRDDDGIWREPKDGYAFSEINCTEYLIHLNGTAADPRVAEDEDPAQQVVLRSCAPETACSDYALYTLSRMGVGNALLLIFTPYFMMLLLVILQTVVNPAADRTDDPYFCGCSNAALFLTVSFIIQTVVIVCGVFGVSLFSGLSLPLVAKGNFDMLVNGISAGIILAAIGMLPKNQSEPNRPAK